MATLPKRRVAILVFLLLGLCVSAPARQTPAPHAGPRIALTVRLSREGQLYPITYADFYLVIFRCLIEAARLRTARRLRPEARPDVVGATAEQQIEALAIRGEDCISASGGPIGRGPVAVGEIAVIGAIGVSGGTGEQDQAVAEAGASAL